MIHQELWFYNAPVGGVELIKVNEADRTERIPNTTFEIRRVSDDALVDTVTTGRKWNGVPPSGERRLLRREETEASGMDSGWTIRPSTLPSRKARPPARP